MLGAARGGLIRSGILLSPLPSTAGLPQYLLHLLPAHAAPMKLPWFLSSLLLLAPRASSSPYRDDLVGYNLNVVKDAQSPLQYDSERPNTTYTPSPQNWRALPTYTILMDKFADGDPSNNDFFKSPYEWDWRETQLRTGGDLKGLESKLDYLEGMGVKVIFMSGTPFLNMLWQADSKCQLDPLPAPSLIVPQVTRPSTSASSTPTGATSTTGAISSTRSTPAACISWPISRWAPCPI